MGRTFGPPEAQPVKVHDRIEAGRNLLFRPFRAMDFLNPKTQGVALGWHVFGPLALRACRFESAVQN
jgi:hypothetical protein